MKILLTADPELPVPPLLYGGIERIVDALATGLAAAGHRVGLVAHRESRCPAAEVLYPWPGFRSQRPLDTMRNTAALLAAVRDFRPDVLHSFSRLLYMLPLLRARLPKLMSYQRRPGMRPVRWGAHLARGSLRFTGCSEHICREGRVAGGTWDAVHNFVDIAAYQFNPRVAPDAPLVFLSRVEPLKGAHVAIEVARHTGRRLLIAGNHASSGEEGRYWETQIRPHLGGGIEYVGPVDDAQKNRLLGAAAATIVPIQWDEPFGIVFAESLACGTPVIACPRGALPEIVRDGIDGFLVNDTAEAVLAVHRLGEIDRRVCRERAERCFSALAIVPRYAALYAAMTAVSR